MNARALLALGAVVLMTLTGCATAQPSVATLEDGDNPYTAPPLPNGAEFATPLPPVTDPEPDCGDPTASLRPDPAGPMPTVDAIRARGHLVVGLDTGSNLMSFRDPSTGTVQGFDVDIAREVARDLFGDPNRLDFKILTSADRLRALEEGSVDIVAKTMTITCERRQTVEFSSQYFVAHQRVLVVGGSGVDGVDDLGGRTVCVARGTTSLTRLQELLPDARILTVPMWSDCLVVLQQHQVDAVSTDDTILAGLASQDPYLEIVGDSLGIEPYGIGIPPAATDLVRFVNGTLERIRRDGTWTRLYDTWLTTLGPAPAPPAATYRD